MFEGFIVYLILGGIINLFRFLYLHSEGTAKKIYEKLFWGFVIVAGILLAGVILLAVGWFWWHFCGGFFMATEDTFLGKAIWGLISLIPLCIFGGLIAILFGWDPNK